MVINESCVNMSKFRKANLNLILDEIEIMEINNENIWVPIGILEMMYDDDKGAFDCYFHTHYSERNREWLFKQLIK